jgi:hypothetical protein
VNGIIRYSHGDSINGLVITGMGYHGRWNKTDQVLERALSDGLVGRFGALDPTDGGDTYRYRGSLDWQRGTAQTLTRVSAYGIGYGLNLFSNFTYALNDPFRLGHQRFLGRRFIALSHECHE